MYTIYNKKQHPNRNKFLKLNEISPSKVVGVFLLILFKFWVTHHWLLFLVRKQVISLPEWVRLANKKLGDYIEIA